MSASELLALLRDDVVSAVDQAATPLSEVAAPDLPVESILRGTLPADVTTNPKIVIVDDEPVVIKVVRKHLASEGYTSFVTTSEPGRAMDIIRAERPDLILLDIMMPKVSGLEVLEQVRADKESKDLPVIILTASSDRDTKVRALELGATDFLEKPVDFVELLTRVRNTLAAKAHYDHLKRYVWGLELETPMKAMELIASRLEVIHCLARAAEDYAGTTGNHVARVGRYSAILAGELGLKENTVTAIEHSAPLHDLGMIGFPDCTPLEAYRFTIAEIEMLRRSISGHESPPHKPTAEQGGIVKSHTGIGAKLLKRGNTPLLRMAARIALSHHESSDGTGYPIGLAGNDIPLEGRIVRVADTFDVLSSTLVYNPPFPLDECFAIMKAGRGGPFDPTVLDAFLHGRGDIEGAQAEYADGAWPPSHRR